MAYRWRLLLVAAGVYVGFGLVAASFAPIVGIIADDLGLTLGQMGTVLGAWQFVYLFAAIPAGRLLDRVGVRTGLTIGIVLIVLSGVARTLAGGWFSLLAAVGVFGFGGPLISVGVPTLVSGWFDTDERPLATGLSVSAPGIGGIATLLLANSVLMPLFDDRWRLVVLTFAGAAALLGVAWVAVAFRPPPDLVDPWHRSEGGRVNIGELIRVPIVRTILVLAILTFFINHALANWLPEMLVDQGLTRSGAATWAAVVSAVGLIAGLTIPRLARPDRRRPMLIGCYVILGLALLPLAGSWGAATIVGLVLMGATRSIALPLAMLFMMDSDDVGPANMAGAGALYFTAGEIGGVSGPVIVGVVADAGGFAPAAWLMGGVAALAAIVSVRLANERGATGPS